MSKSIEEKPDNTVEWDDDYSDWIAERSLIGRDSIKAGELGKPERLERHYIKHIFYNEVIFKNKITIEQGEWGLSCPTLPESLKLQGPITLIPTNPPTLMPRPDCDEDGKGFGILSPNDTI